MTDPDLDDRLRRALASPDRAADEQFVARIGVLVRLEAARRQARARAVGACLGQASVALLVAIGAILIGPAALGDAVRELLSLPGVTVPAVILAVAFTVFGFTLAKEGALS